MKIVKSLSEINTAFGLTIGNFDGVHIGHSHMLKQVREYCNKENIPMVVMTFVPHPVQVLSPQKNYLLNSYAQRRALLAQSGIDYLVEIDFNRDLSTKSAGQFIDEYILKNKLISKFYVGHDFAFGSGKSGDYEFISGYCKKHGLDVIAMKKFIHNHDEVSSSIVRRTLDDGDVHKASIFLSRMFSVTGVVVKGEGRGKRIGVPTANLMLSDFMKYPKSGVYITKTTLSGQTWCSLTNIGNNPTFNETKESVFIETHILDFDNDIYGEDMSIEFIQRLRDEMKFSDVNSLVAQIHKDIESAKRYFNEN